MRGNDPHDKPASHNESSGFFGNAFRALAFHEPMPWQLALFERFVHGNPPSSCDLPTGLGKTSIIHIWLIALAAAPTEVPRRLVYVVNRRTVVDQATREAEKLRARLAGVETVRKRLEAICAFEPDVPLAISTLRGQFADNGDWRNDPARPALIIGTVDMIGSRLLFSGYGCGMKSAPLHAGFLGQDTLVVHDEAHLEPAFQELLVSIRAEQLRCGDIRPLQVMALTATSRSGNGAEVFGLTEQDGGNAVVQRRVNAKKGISFHPVDDGKVADRVADLALKHEGSNKAILIFLRKLEDVEAVARKLEKENVQLLTGTLRGMERDRMARAGQVFARFLPPDDVPADVEPAPGTVYLICTSAGEVGVNITADHLVCDLTPFDSMAQRFGRVNRFGDGDARIDVCYEARPAEKEKDSPYEQSRWATLALLQSLPNRSDGRHDASPLALSSLPAENAAFTPPPVILPASDILFDAWALTTVRGRLPGRPPVADWLHGVRKWEPPETHVAWREEVGLVAGELLTEHPPEELLDDFPLKPHELLRDRTSRIAGELKKLATRSPNLPAWVIEPDGEVVAAKLDEIVTGRHEDSLAGCIVLLPPGAGGLRLGMLAGDAKHDPADAYDVADEWLDEHNSRRRQRVWADEPAPAGMRLVRTIMIRDDGEGGDGQGEDETAPLVWRWYVRPQSADDDGSRTARLPVALAPHLRDAEDHAARIAAALRLDRPAAAALTLAARWHDLGKNRAVWQRSIGNQDYLKKPPTVLAKCGGKMQPIELSNYRHEFGSLRDVASLADFQKETPEVQELVLHLIAAHHGRARPHFPAEECFDHESRGGEDDAVAIEAPRRFARLQRRYGRWGLAYLESLLRAADYAASANPSGTAAGAEEAQT